MKWDGVRALTYVDAGTVTMTSRNGNRITAAWPDLATPPAAVREAVVDGEIIALNERGVPDSGSSPSACTSAAPAPWRDWPPGSP